MITRGRAIGDGPFLDLAAFPELYEQAMASRPDAMTRWLDRFLVEQYDGEIEARFARAPAPAQMVKGGRS